MRVPSRMIRGVANGRIVEIELESGDTPERIVQKAIMALQAAGLSDETIRTMLMAQAAALEGETDH